MNTLEDFEDFGPIIKWLIPFMTEDGGKEGALMGLYEASSE